MEHSDIPSYLRSHLRTLGNAINPLVMKDAVYLPLTHSSGGIHLPHGTNEWRSGKETQQIRLNITFATLQNFQDPHVRRMKETTLT